MCGSKEPRMFENHRTTVQGLLGSKILGLGRSDAGIVGSNSAGGVDFLSLFLCVVLFCAGEVLRQIYPHPHLSVQKLIQISKKKIKILTKKNFPLSS